MIGCTQSPRRSCWTCADYMDQETLGAKILSIWKTVRSALYKSDRAKPPSSQTARRASGGSSRSPPLQGYAVRRFISLTAKTVAVDSDRPSAVG